MTSLQGSSLQDYFASFHIPEKDIDNTKNLYENSISTKQLNPTLTNNDIREIFKGDSKYKNIPDKVLDRYIADAIHTKVQNRLQNQPSEYKFSKDSFYSGSTSDYHKIKQYLDDIINANPLKQINAADAVVDAWTKMNTADSGETRGGKKSRKSRRKRTRARRRKDYRSHRRRR